MNSWIWVGAGLLLALVPCGISIFRGEPTDRPAVRNLAPLPFSPSEWLSSA